MSTTPPPGAEVHDAVVATSTAYTDDATVDVEQRLRAELRERGLEVDDEAWLGEVARAIRSGHDVRVDLAAPSTRPTRSAGPAGPATAPGSLGGDNGGG